MKFISFDLEIAKVVPNDGSSFMNHRPLGISCAATLTSIDERPTLWFDGQYAPPGTHYGPRMTRDGCRELVAYLMTEVKRGYVPLTWNGLSFDFSVLAEESGMYAECRALALNHVDMMFHFFCLKGFPVGLQAACEGMGLEGKTEGMSGAEAPALWPTQPERVLEYVGNDVIQPLKLAHLVQQRGGLAWVAKSGRINSVTIPRWLTVRQALELELPDTSWMSTPMTREYFMKEWLEVSR